MVPTIRIKDQEGQWIEVPAFRGKTAYEYAVEKGYTGSEADFTKKLGDIASAPNAEEVEF